MTRGIHGLPKVSPGPSIPDPSTPCGPFRGWSAHSAGGLRPSSTSSNNNNNNNNNLHGYPLPYVYGSAVEQGDDRGLSALAIRTRLID
jgi:hypothetical protein